MSATATPRDTDLPVFAKPDTTVSPGPVRTAMPAVSRPRVESTQHKLNTWLSIALVATLVLATIPLGSNRPAFWALWGVVIGLIGLAYAVLLVFLHGKLRVRVRQFWPEALLFLGLCLFLAFQVLPIGRWLPQSIAARDGTAIAMNSFSLDPGSTWLVLMQFASFAMLFFLTVQVAANRRRARRLLVAVLGIVTAGAIYGLVSLTQLGDTILGFEKQFYQGYATGTFVNRNSFATFLAMGLALAVPLLLDSLLDPGGRQTLSRRLGQGAAVLVCVVFITAALFATGSRMGTLAGGLGALLALALSVLTMRGTARLAIGVLLAAGAVAVLLLALFGSELIERLVLLPGIDDGRTGLHLQVWSAIWQRPWFGYGGGSFASVFPVFQEPSAHGNLFWDHTHSTYLALWFELGLVAGSIPLAIILLLAGRSFRALSDPSSTVISVAALGAGAVMAIHSLLDFSAEIEANAFLFTVILALGAAGAIGGRTPSNIA